ncbi:hypothetical protein CR513_05173, partial [Mucuna pruriens]
MGDSLSELRNESCGLNLFQFSHLVNENDDYWCLRMKVMLGSQDAWEFVEKGYTIPEDVTNLSQNEKETNEDEKKKDQQALTFIYRTLDEAMFEMIQPFLIGFLV